MSRSTERRGTFNRRLIGGFAVTIALTALMGAASIATVVTVARSTDTVVASGTRQLSDSQQLNLSIERRIDDYRAYLIAGQREYLDAFNADRQQFLAQATSLRAEVQDPIAVRLLGEVIKAERAYSVVLDPVMRRRTAITDLTDITQLNAVNVKPAREALVSAVDALVIRLRATLDEHVQTSSRTATTAILIISVLGGLAIISAVLIGVWLNNRLRRQVGAAAARIQDSSLELEVEADLHAAGRRHPTGAMDEITATISELLIASRRIADSARQVTEVTDQTLHETTAGEATLDRARDSIAAIRAQVDRVATRMHALDGKSLKIGGVLGLAAELAEQTNILAVNATIEADGSGHRAGKFADDVLKLADRTAESARQVRTLIDDLRDAVDTTVAVTGSGARAVDAAAEECGHVTASLRRVAELVSSASDAGRDIELSSRQQSSAVEQINIAVGEAARATRETEAAAAHTRKTAAHLSSLSQDLRQIVGAAY
ncbi:methyl-accepting chemotaxis protein [Actinoplanes sp. NPDC051411]|uniref:HAMP domain-containing methyl-accepting chemotaxis protein n=1 Tax=Actinoplanes sp. NPDC051411 TaxID=3155522 RepID=UPI00341DCEC6